MLFLIAPKKLGDCETIAANTNLDEPNVETALLWDQTVVVDQLYRHEECKKVKRGRAREENGMRVKFGISQTKVWLRKRDERCTRVLQPHNKGMTNVTTKITTATDAFVNSRVLDRGIKRKCKKIN